MSITIREKQKSRKNGSLISHFISVYDKQIDVNKSNVQRFENDDDGDKDNNDDRFGW